MKSELLLDIEGLPPEHHRSVVRNVQDICTHLYVREVDNRTERLIDVQDISVLTGIVSAICTIVGLALQYLQLKKQKRSTPEMNIESITSEVQTKLSVELSDEIKTTLHTAFESKRLPPEIMLHVHKRKYSLKTYEEHGHFLIKGRYSGS